MPLVVAANRDEFHDRPSLPAALWPDAPEILAGDDEPGRYLVDVAAEAKRYNGFNLVVGRPGDLWVLESRGGRIARLGAGTFGMSNGSLDAPWPKVLRSTVALDALLRGGARAGPHEPLRPPCGP